MIEYIWSIYRAPDCLPKYKATDNFVQIVYWQCVSGGASFSGSTQLAPGAAPYVKYEDLTEETLLGWVFDALGNEKDAIEAKVAAQLAPAALVAPPLPWSTDSGAEDLI